jgi:murein DD-endopeptidase MepM/ murein hydrolase activator NlpD
MDDRAALAHAADENERKRWDCSLYPEQASSPYVLPWRVGEEYLVWRTTEHFTRGNGGVGLYAIDIEMRIGTSVVAARAGVVAATRDHFEDGNGRDLEENYIFVRHDDGSIARYMHLTREGVMVAEGQAVAQGELLGLSGNTGESAGPHLHFDVQRCGPNLPPDYNRLPCGQTLPVTFRNTSPHECGLQPGRSYRALG